MLCNMQVLHLVWRFDSWLLSTEMQFNDVVYLELPGSATLRTSVTITVKDQLPLSSPTRSPVSVGGNGSWCPGQAHGQHG